jgi:hypothetical protein
VGNAVYETIANGIRRRDEDDRNVARGRLKSFGFVRAGGNQDVGPQRHEFGGQPRKARWVRVTKCVGAPLEIQIIALVPAERMQIGQ